MKTFIYLCFCIVILSEPPLPTMTPYTVQLVNGNATAGRVELTINNVTGTVCDDYWSDENCAVVCYEILNIRLMDIIWLFDYSVSNFIVDL